MPVVKLSHIVSFSSEDKDHQADNLLKGNGGKWKCEVGGETNPSVVIQLEKAVQITSIDVGNDGSAFVEVLVNRSAANDQNFQVLLSAQGLMNPTESRETTSTGRVKIFGKQKLSEKISQHKWDLVKFVCTQPFNKRVKYGLSFITIHSKEEVKKEVATSHSNVIIEEKKPAVKFGGFKLLPDIKTEDENPAKYRQYLLDEAAKHGVEISIIDKMSVKTKSDADEILNEKLRNKNKMTIKKNGHGNSTKVDRDSDKSTPNNQKRKMAVTSSSGDVDLPPLKRKVVRQPVPLPSSPSTSSKPSSSKSTTPQQVTAKATKTSTSKDTSSAKLPNTMLTKKVEDKVKEKEKEKVKKSKPRGGILFPSTTNVRYEEILKDVVFVLSGFVHPERFDLRELATSMGASYAREWDHSCTHLICAFRNTPKYKQVLNSDNKGFIVKENWLHACDREKRKVPIRKYKMMKNDSDDDSDDDDDDVIIQPATTPPPQKTPTSSMTSHSKPSTSSTPSTAMTSSHTNGSSNHDDDVTPARSDDDDNEEQVRLFRGGRTRIETTSEKCDDVTEIDDDIYDAETEVEDNIDDDDDVMVVKDAPPPFPELPDFLRKIRFYIYGDFDDDVDRLLRRIIIACHGKLSNYMGDKVTHVITNSKSWSKVFDDAAANNPNLMFISSTWVYECGVQQKLIDHTPYLISKK